MYLRLHILLSSMSLTEKDLQKRSPLSRKLGEKGISRVRSGICNSNLPIYSFLLQIFIEDLLRDRISARCQGLRGEQKRREFARVGALVSLLQHQARFNLRDQV